jgi:hypothetical protein
MIQHFLTLLLYLGKSVLPSILAFGKSGDTGEVDA